MSTTLETPSLSLSKNKKIVKRALSPDLHKGIFTPQKSERLYTQGAKPNTRNMSASNGFFSSRAVPNKHLELQIHHETKQLRVSEATRTTESTTLGSPRRNPILQDNDEPSDAFKPSVKRIEGAGDATLFTAEDKPRNVKPGEYHPVHNAKVKKEKVSSIMKIHFSPSKSHHELKKRELKAVKSARETFNPIVDGDPKSVKPVKIRNFDQEISDHSAKHNEKKFMLPADRKFSNRLLNSGPSPTKARLNLHPEDVELAQQSAPSTIKVDYNTKVHPMVKKHRGEIGGVLSYDTALPYRHDGVTDKPHRVPPKIVAVCLANTEKHFAKRKAVVE